MIKKVLISLIMLLPMAVAAQYAPGYWKVHPSFLPSQAKNVIDAGEKVYMHTGNNLFSFNKQTHASDVIDKSHNANDVLVNKVYFNSYKGYVVVTYLNSNMDVILPDGKIVNMPEVKDAVVTSGKAINDITFTADGTMLVATEFGYLVIDDTNFVVKESHLYYNNFSSIAQVGSTLVAVIGNSIYCSPAAANHTDISSFVATGKNLAGCTLYPINDTKLFVNSSTKFFVGVVGGTAAKPTLTLTAQETACANNVQETPAGFLVNFMDSCRYYTFDRQGNQLMRIEGGNEMYSCYAAGDGTLWALGANGLHISGDETNYYRPSSITVADPFWAVYNQGLNKLYVHTSADNSVLTSSSSCRLMAVSAYDGVNWVDETPELGGTDRKAFSAYPICVNPKDPHTYVFSIRGSNKSFIYKVTDGKTVDRYTNDNTPGGYYRGATAFDSQGNLWIVYSYGDALPSGSSHVVALPSDKVNSTAPVVKSDWKKINVPNIEKNGAFKRASFCISPSDVKVYTDGDQYRPIFFWKDGIDVANPSVRTYVDFTDQDGQKVSWSYMRCMAMDKNGQLWFSTGTGVVSVNADDAVAGTPIANHIKVPRNDGTDLADYLLQDETVNCITVDSQNRKWIGTAISGAFQVSEDGTQILQQFNKENSMLPSNAIYSIACADNGSVFILTDSGLVEYVPGNNPTAADLSNVTCYPNPVEPDYTGLLTISGLTANVTVKIADAAGNVLKQLRHAGGIATWDCCGSDGNRVPTGVYYVLASTDGSADTIVSKFLVVK